MAFVSGLIVPECLPGCANVHNFTLSQRSDQQTYERAAKLHVKAAFASLSVLSSPAMPTCEGTHSMIIWNCGRIFLGDCTSRNT